MKKPMLHHLPQRMRAAPSIGQIVLANSLNMSDDVLESFASQCGIAFCRGSEDESWGESSVRPRLTAADSSSYQLSA